MAMKVTFEKRNDAQIKAGDVFVAMNESRTPWSTFTKGKEYVVVPADCGCCEWAVKDDNGNMKTAEDNVPLMIRKEVAEPELPPERYRWQKPEIQAALLVARSMGEPIQEYVDGKGWVDYNGGLSLDGFYRKTPTSVLKQRFEKMVLQRNIEILEARVDTNNRVQSLPW